MGTNSVSVIIPCFNAASFVSEAIESALSQDHEPLSVIVVDDGSTDESAELLKAFRDRVQVIRQPRSGPAKARNAGLKQSTGEFIAFLDADDLWVPHKIRSQLAFLQAHPECHLVLGKVRRFRDINAIETTALHGPYLGSALIRRSVFEKVGALDPLLSFAEDVDWFLRVLEAGFRLSLMESDSLLYRQHISNLTNHGFEARQSLVKALHRSLKRRTQARLQIAREGH